MDLYIYCCELGVAGFAWKSDCCELGVVRFAWKSHVLTLFPKEGVTNDPPACIPLVVLVQVAYA